MPLEETELREEQLQQLRRLDQSPGWALLRQRLAQLVQRNEAEKAKLLRDSVMGRETRASYLQGHVDGVQAAMSELTKYAQELERAVNPPSPVY